MSLVRPTTSLASLTRLSLLALLLLGCGTEDRTAPPTDGAGEREEVVELATDLEVRDVGEALRALRTSVEVLGGHVERSERAELAHLVVRVPVEALEDVRGELDALDPERTEREGRLDVTRTRADLGARLHSARATEERLLALLADRTATLADVLAAERELARVRTEIEVAETKERVLLERVRYASLDVTIRHRTPAWRDELLAAMGRAFSSGIETSWSVLVALGVIGAALTPRARRARAPRSRLAHDAPRARAHQSVGSRPSAADLGEPIADRVAGAERPRLELRDRHALEGLELGTEHGLAVDLDVVGDDELVPLRERVDPDGPADLGVETDLLAQLSQDALLGRLAGLEEPGDEREPRRRPAVVAHEDDVVPMLHDRSDDGRGVAIEDEPTRRLALASRAAQPRAALFFVRRQG
jgi:hypothetical protein